MGITITCRPNVPDISLASGRLLEVAVNAYAEPSLHCNAADLVVEFDAARLAFHAAIGPSWFPDCRLFGLYELKNGAWVLDKSIIDGDFGYTVWAAMLGSDPARYPAVTADGRLLATFTFRPVATGAAFVRLSADPARHLSARTKLYDATRPNYQRPADELLGAAVTVTV